MLYAKLGSTEAVAVRLNLAVGTVKDHLWHAYGKLEATGPAQALWRLVGDVIEIRLG